MRTCTFSFSTERTPEAAMSLSDEYSPADLAKLLIERCGSADAAEEFLKSTLAEVRPQAKGDGGDGGGDGGTPAPTIQRTIHLLSLIHI